VKFQIKNRYSGELIIEVEAENWRFAVELAIKQKANLSSANLSSANLRSADLSSANLRSADLSYANLSYADLSYANLSSADLSYANLRSANLRSANLSSANLRSANLSSANLSYANLSYADLLNTKGMKYLPIQIVNMKYFATIFDDYVQWGCRKFTFDQLKSLEFKDLKTQWDEPEFKLNKKILTESIRYYREKHGVK